MQHQRERSPAPPILASWKSHTSMGHKPRNVALPHASASATGYSQATGDGQDSTVAIDEGNMLSLVATRQLYVGGSVDTLALGTPSSISFAMTGASASSAPRGFFYCKSCDSHRQRTHHNHFHFHRKHTHQSNNTYHLSPTYPVTHPLTAIAEIALPRINAYLP
jgi:hypothetical protein